MIAQHVAEGGVLGEVEYRSESRQGRHSSHTDSHALGYDCSAMRADFFRRRRVFSSHRNFPNSSSHADTEAGPLTQTQSRNAKLETASPHFGVKHLI